MATLTNQNQWYDVATNGPYTSTIDGNTATWINVIQARWTSLSGTVYSVEYRCVIRKTSGNLATNISAYAGWSIGGTGASTVTGGTSEQISFPNVGDNQIGITSGSINGTSGTVNGGVRLGYYGTTWGETTLSGDITLPSVGAAPSVPTLSLYGVSTSTITVSYQAIDWGSDSSGTVVLQSKTVNASSWSTSQSQTDLQSHRYTVSLAPNTARMFRVMARNTVGNTISDSITAATLPKLSDIYVRDSSTTNVEIGFSVSNNGGYYAQTIQYSLDGGNTWVDGYTVSSGGVVRGHFTIQGLTQGVPYTVLTRIVTTAGSSTGNTLTFIAGGVSTGVYVPVNNQAESMAKLYGSVNNQAKKIIKIYGSVNGQAELIYEKK